MAAYAAVVSLMNTISLELIPHPTRSHTSAETKQMESLSERLGFLQEFLQGEWKEAKYLEGRIADAAHAAEDAIESNVVDQVLVGSTTQNEMGSDQLCRDLLKVIEDMDSIKNELMHIKETGRFKDHQIHKSSVAPPSRAPPFEKNRMVGFDHEKLRIMEELAGQHSSSRQVITIVGMGGGGKTTLARNVYDDRYIVHYFDIRAWFTVSQEYNVRDILIGVLLNLDIRKQGANRNLAKSVDTFSDEMLGEQVHKSLSGRRYLIVLDDIWSIECWDFVKRYFPDNSNGSRVVVTTRLSNLSNQIGTTSVDMKFLDEDTSWALFCEKVFAQKSCPQELIEIGKKIVQHCKGLPLALVVIGGLLKKSSMTLEYWEQVAENVSSAISLDVDEHCSEILYSSYDHLPVHLKPCFLYMGVFPEDHEIRASELTKLWIAEGFLKPCKGKSMEDIADNFLKDLIERNLIFIHKLGSSGKVKSCKIHDMLRDLSISEALKEKFLCMIGPHNLDVQLVTSTRLVLNQRILENERHENFHPLKMSPLARSLVCNYVAKLPALTYRLLLPLRVLNVVKKHSHKPTREYKYPLEVVFQLVNSRYLAFEADWKSNVIPSSICQLRNIQTLVIRGNPRVVPVEIWDMPQLKHIKFDTIILPDPIFGQNDRHKGIVLEDLQTLKRVSNFRCSKEILQKIPYVKKLRIDYDKTFPMEPREWSHYSLQNLGCFQTLESFACFFRPCKVDRNVLMQNIAFPHSLKKLTLDGCQLFWEDMTMIGSLPHLEVLKLKLWSFQGASWDPIEGEFLSLKFLLIDYCELVNWNADSSHFPRLEQLFLGGLDKLEEIPLDIGEIPTLWLIQLKYCSDSAVVSAKNIVEEQESLGNVGLQVNVHFREKNELESLASENFHVETFDRRSKKRF